MFHWPAFLEAFPVLMSGLVITIELTVLVMPCAVVAAGACTRAPRKCSGSGRATIYVPGSRHTSAASGSGLTRNSGRPGARHPGAVGYYRRSR